MNTDSLLHLLLWSLLFNYLVLLVWFFAFVFAHDWLYRFHGRWFHFSEPVFDAIHYGGMVVYKIGILLFNLAPVVALCLIRHGGQ